MTSSGSRMNGPGPDGGGLSSSPSTSSFANQQQLELVICELCFDEVDDNAVPNQNITERSMMTKMMKNFCHHMQFPSSSTTTLPDNLLPGEIVPLCGECVQVIKTLWDLQCLVEKAVNKMERTVVDSQILFPNKESKNPGSNGYVLRLREMILEGYCAKLRKNQQERNKQAFGLFGIDNHNQQQLHNPGGQALINSAACSSVNPSGFVAHQLPTTAMDNDDGSEPSSSAAPRALSTSIGNEGKDFSREDDGDEGEQKKSFAPNSDDGNKDKETDVDSNGVGYLGRHKQEAELGMNGDGSEQGYGDDDGAEGAEEEEADEEDDVFIIERNKSRLIIDGVEVFECTTGSKPGVRYLQCGSCNLTLSIPVVVGDAGSGVAVAESQMKRHVQFRHQKMKKLSSTKACKNHDLRSPKSVSSGKRSVPSIECDICLRPIPANRPQNLFLHRLTHMSEAEQQEALAARGKATSGYNFLTSKKSAERNSSQSQTTGETGIPAAKKSRSSSSNWAGQDGNAPEKKRSYTFRNRFLQSENYLNLHLRTPGKVMMQPSPSPPPPQQNPRLDRGSNKEEFLHFMDLVQKKPEQN